MPYPVSPPTGCFSCKTRDLASELSQALRQIPPGPTKNVMNHGCSSGPPLGPEAFRSIDPFNFIDGVKTVVWCLLPNSRPQHPTTAMSNMRQKAIAGLKPGDSFTVSRTFTEKDMIAFADISRDYNPVHFDDRFANIENFRGRICHGLLVASLVTEAGGQMGWLASGMNFRFKRPVYFGDTVECSLTIAELDDRNRAKVEVVFKNQQNEIVIEASLTGIIPGFPERRVMEAMMAEGDPTNKCR
jgi:3-hydroxybutyryl-CoA dehydratase